jgi:2,4-diketo-3-deoxy-L-fuconate hydrolase
MKLVRFGPAGKEQPGVWLENTPTPGKTSILDVRALVFDIEDYNEQFFTHWGLKRLENLLKESGRKLIPADGVRLGPAVAKPEKIICLGKNYADHAMEFDSEVPTTPIYFSKAPSAIIGPFDPVRLPPESKRVDGEVELAVVMGKTAKNVAEADAMDYVAGFTILNDITDRDAQRDSKQWFRGKGVDTFCPIGPFLITRDEAGDPFDWTLSSKINDTVLQQSSTKHMIFKIPFIISHLSRTMTLRAGDIIATGTPGGIGSARKPPVLLKPGDTVEAEIQGLGRQKNPVE